MSSPANLSTTESRMAGHPTARNTVLVSTVATAKHTATTDNDALQIIERIRSDKRLRGNISHIRDKFSGVMTITNGDRGAAKKAVGPLKTMLPGVIWSGTFTRRNKDALLQHSGLLCADLDELGAENLLEIGAKLQTSLSLWALFVSPTGDGLKAVFRVPASRAKHQASFHAVEQHVRDLTGRQIDAACSDVSRLCFLSHDPDAYLNEKAVELSPLQALEPPEKAVAASITNNAEFDWHRAIAAQLLGDIEWMSATRGRCACPGQQEHSTGEGERDCEVYLDGTPTVHCFHNHCRELREETNRKLRRHIEAVGAAWPGTDESIGNKPILLVCRLVDLEPAAIDDGNTLLGFRFLCRGGGCLFVGASGIGKSTAVMQMAICWSVGRPCFGITPAKPLKILYIQAENDEGDLCEMRDGVFEHLDEFTPDEGRALKENFHCAFESSQAGEEFVTKTLEPLLEQHAPDLVIIDPVLSYLGGDANKQEVVGPFLRNRLNPLLQKHRCAALIVHHTAKQSGERDSKGKVATDFAYAGTGSAEWANWARGVLVLRAKDDYGLRELRIAKRFRLGWKDDAGKPSHSKLLRQNSEGAGLFYSELSSEEATVLNPKLHPFDRIIRSDGILPQIGQDMAQCALIARIQQSKICGRDAARDVIALLVEEKYLIKREADRPGARPEIRYERTEKRHNVVAFG